MQGNPARRLLATCTCACALAACAAQHSPPQHPVASTADEPVACGESSHARKRREMTWAEYYTDVIQRSRRSNAMIIWVNPPDVREVAVAGAPDDCR